MLTVRDLPLDGVVREPGAYRMPLGVYHTQAVCPGPSFSSSGLRTILMDSPAGFWAFSEMNPERFVQDPTDALIFGRAAHALLLGDEVFDEHFVVLDDDAPRRPTKPQIKARAEGRITPAARASFDYWETIDGFGLTPIPGAWMEHITGMSRSLQAHPLIGPLFDGTPEVSLIWQDEQTGLWLKARPDMLPQLGEAIADLKTTRDASKAAVLRDTARHGYAMQLELARIGYEQVTGQRIENAVLVYVQKTPPYHVSAVEIAADALHYAGLRLRRAIQVAAECLDLGRWPAPVEGILRFDLLPGEQERIADEIATGALPASFHAPREDAAA